MQELTSRVTSAVFNAVSSLVKDPVGTVRAAGRRAVKIVRYGTRLMKSYARGVKTRVIEKYNRARKVFNSARRATVRAVKRVYRELNKARVRVRATVGRIKREAVSFVKNSALPFAHGAAYEYTNVMTGTITGRAVNYINPSFNPDREPAEFQAGRVLGSAAGLYQGIAELIGGAGEIVGGGGIAVFGAPETAGASIAVGGAISVKGVALAGVGIAHTGFGVSSLYNSSRVFFAKRAEYIGPSAEKWDWDHIFAKHSDFGKIPKGNKKTSFEGLTKPQVKARCQAAWKNRKRIETQGDRIKYRGTDPQSGKQVEFWYNQKTKTVETAYPID